MLSSLLRSSASSWVAAPGAEAVAFSMINQILTEAMAVGRAAGYEEADLPQALIQEIPEAARAMHKSGFTPSSLLDVLLEKPFELEVTLGEVIKMAATRNVSVPVRDV